MSESPETDALRKDFEQLRKDFTALSESVRHRSNQQVQAGINQAGDRLRGIESEIESRPYTGMLTAFGIGLLIGKLFSR